MRRILYVDSGGESTGAHNAFADMILAVKRGGQNEVAAVIPAHTYVYKRLESAGVELFRGRLPRRMVDFSFWSRLKYALLPNRSIAQAVKAFQPHIVHANGVRTFIVAWLSVPRSIPVIWHARQYNLRPRVVAGSRKRAACLITSSTMQSRLLLGHKQQSVMGAPCTVIPPCVCIDSEPLSREAVRKKLAIPQDARVVGMVADFIPEKRHGILIQEAEQIARSIPNLHLLFIGRGDSRGYLRRQWGRALGSIPVRWVTDVNRATDLMRAFDVLVSPSTKGTYGRVVAEAMLLGIPLVARDPGGSHEYLVEGKTSLLVSVGHRQRGDVASAVVRLLQDSELAANLATQAQSLATDRFQPEKMATRLASTYEQILRHATSRSEQDSLDEDD